MTPEEEEAILAKHERLMFKVASNHHHLVSLHLPWEDLVQECRIALLKSSRMWNPGRAQFSTYATRAMHNACVQAHRDAFLRGYEKNKTGDEPPKVYSLDSFVRSADGVDDEFERLISRLASGDNPAEEVLLTVRHEELRAFVRRVLGTKGGGKTRQVFELFYELADGRAWSIAEIAEELGLSEQAVKIRLVRSRRWLQEAAREMGLDAA